MKHVLLACLLIFSQLSWALTTRSDVSYQLDHTAVNVKIDELTEGSINYFEATAPKQKALVDQPTQQPDGQAFSRIHLTIGPEISLFSQSGTKRWNNELSGLGMHQSIGASLRLDYRFVRALALSLTGGYAQWEMVRNYLQNGTEKYDETIQLTRIPVQAGIKLYPWRGLYLLPEAGVNLLTTSVKTSSAHPAPTDHKSSATPVTYGASLGYEFSFGALLIDVSGRYQILNVKNLDFGSLSPALTEKVQFGSLRIGIGFNAYRK